MTNREPEATPPQAVIPAQAGIQGDDEDSFACPESLYPIVCEVAEAYERQAENGGPPLLSPQVGCTAILKELSALVDLVMMGRGFRKPQRDTAVKVAVAAMRFIRGLD